MSPEKPPIGPSFPIVAVCASAGGLAAYQAFFSGGLPAKEPGMAFVVVQHLDPVHKSLLAGLIRGFSTLEVFEVTEGLPVTSNTIYVVPPGKEMTVSCGVLHLTDQKPLSGLRLPINVFLESLAQDQEANAAAVILSGTGNDGTLGSGAIRKRGGYVLAQTKDSSEYPGMPASAVATGQVHAVLAPQDMIPVLENHFKQRTSPSPNEEIHLSEMDPVALQNILVLLKAQTTHDFSQYKPSTIRRRIERRVAVHRLGNLADYLARLEKDPAELTELFNDILIGVTSFFRDPEVFELLETRVLPQLVARQPRGTKIRAWSVGCSTGEEPYSLAMLLRESIDALALEHTVEVFATDLDKRAIATARAGVYQAAAGEVLTAERVKRYFVPSTGVRALRISKTIRNLVVFSEHDVLKDPPFSKLDLLVCRNLLIYFSLDLQKRLLPMFFHALNPGGILVLGTSETVGEFGHLFRPLDREAKVYQRNEDLSLPPGVHHAPFAMLPMASNAPKTLASVPEKSALATTVSLREITEQMILNAFDMAAVLVDEHGSVYYLHGRTGYFLEPAPGEASTQNILKMAKDGLRHPIATTLHQARTKNKAAHHREVLITWKDHVTVVQVSVHPLKKSSSDQVTPLFLVVLEERPVRLTPPSDEPSPAVRLQQVEEQLRSQQEYLQSTTEQMESSNEELRSSNEELQSVNEELQSTNEELDTSKEELQSVNEELSTVNSELTSKVNLLTTTLNDMTNLLAATGVATVFVDLQLNILRFTPEATRIINLVPGDMGRPVGHLTSNLVNYHNLEQDTQAVLDSLVRFEAEIQTQQKAWYRLRIQPYRTLDNVIEGAVISFGDITEIVHQRQELQANNELLRLVSVIQDSQDPIVVQDLEGKILAWNPKAVALYGWTEAEALATNFREHIPKELRAESLQRIRDLVYSDVLETYQTKRLTKDGRTVEISVTSSALVTKDGRIYAISTTERAKGIRTVP